MSADTIVRGQRVLTGGKLVPAAVLIEDDLILDVVALGDEPEDVDRVLDVGDAVVMPGLVDTHVHVNQPGRTEWEGYETATAAAAAGGVTTLVDMPLNSIPATTTVEALARKRAETEGRLRVDVGLWGGVVPGNAGELAAMIDAGVLGFKCFLIDSGVEEFQPVGRDEVVTALGILGEARVPLLVHAELPGPIDDAMRSLAGADPRRYQTFLWSRPRAAEDQAVSLALAACRETRAPIHIVHHSSADSLAALERARHDDLPVTVETCPHYLHFAAEDIADGATDHKCCPPIRERDNRELLWQALASGVIDMVVSDHSPCTPDLKLPERGDFMAAWGGIASLELGLSVTWTQAHARGHAIPELAAWMCERPARLAGLSRKGRIAPGCDADLVVWRPDATRRVRAGDLHHRNPITPYHGASLRGVVDLTMLRGEIIYRPGELVGAPRGRLVSRTS